MASMKYLLLVLALLCVVIVGSNAPFPAEVYWHFKWPNTPIPQDVLNLLQPGTGDNYTFWHMDLKNTFDDKKQKYEIFFDEGVIDKREKYGKHYGSENTKNSVDDIKSHKYGLYNLIIFFVYNDLYIGQKMRLHITKSTNKAKILPRQIADSIPFSTNKLSEILERFSIKSESRQGKIIKQTIEDCESPEIKGEERYCPTSLESLIDFSVKHIGDKVKILFNEIDKPKRAQEYTIMDVKFMGEDHVVCHKQIYPYAVYYCHVLNGTKVYNVSLVGADGTKAKTVAVCHYDTSAWNPRHLAFLLLNMKPGEGIVCHFIRSDTLVIVSTNEMKEKNSNGTNL